MQRQNVRLMAMAVGVSSRIGWTVRERGTVQTVGRLAGPYFFG
jgi:hypothetical protein